MKPTKHSNTASNNSHPFDMVGDFLEVVISLTISALTFILVFLVKKFFLKTKKDQVIKKEFIDMTKQTTDSQDLGFSVGRNKPFKLADLDTKRHGLIIGASGWGKSNLIRILQENDLSLNRPLIFFDPKGSRDSIEEFISLCKKYDKKYYLFSEFHPDTNHFNPLKNLDVTQAVALIMRSFVWSEPYYQAKSEFALNDAIHHLKVKKIPITFKNIYTFLNKKEVKKATKKEKVKNNTVIKKKKTTKVSEENKENKDNQGGKDNKDIQGLLANLSRIIHSTFGKLLEGQDNLSKTIEDVRKERACLYIGLSTQGYGDLAKSIGKIFLSELMAHSYNVGIRQDSENFSKDNPISVYFDELGSILIPDFIDLLSKCRSSGIEITSAIQCMADLETLSEPLKRQIFENCNNIFIQKQISNQDAQFLSKAIGTYYTTKKTHMILEGEIEDRGSIRESQEYICHPNRLSEIRIGQCILLRHNPKDIDLINIRMAPSSIPKEITNQIINPILKPEAPYKLKLKENQ
jgi:type IV secretory pathway TraG/TraD family ATPase VirD4